MSIALAFVRDFDPPQFGPLKMGNLLIDSLIEGMPARRRYRVREWQPFDGGFQGWKHEGGGWTWHHYPPRTEGEYFTIVRLTDNAARVAPRRWWACDPRGMPRDDDQWAAAAWKAIQRHYTDQRRPFP